MNSAFLQTEESVAFTTHDFAMAEHLSISAASHRLARMNRDGLIRRVTQGIWCNTRHPYFSPLCCIAKLLGKDQGYLSFLSVLHLSGVISQIPATIQVATTSRNRTLHSVVGTFEFFQLKPELMRDGISWSESRIPYRIASCEKAMFDTLYIATRKGRRFAALPEVDLSAKGLRLNMLERLISKADLSKQLKSAIRNRVEKIF